jgi:hypothetical protein
MKTVNQSRVLKKDQKSIEEKMEKNIKRWGGPFDLPGKASACEKCKAKPILSPNFGVFCQHKKEWILRCVILFDKKLVLTGRPKRDEVINDDDILNVKIFAENFK